MVSLSGRQLTVDGVTTRIRPKTSALLAALVNNRGVPISERELLKSIWGYPPAIRTRTVAVHMCAARKALGNHAGLIQTIRGVGYRFQPS